MSSIFDPSSQHHLPDQIVIAADTEFEGPHTLTIQAASRLSNDQIAIQVYRSPLLPKLPTDLELDKYLPAENYGRFFQPPILRPTKLITPDFSPARVVRDLVDTPFAVLSRYEGEELIDGFGTLYPTPPNVSWNQRKERWTIPPITVLVVLHFQPADYLRLFGRNFLDRFREPFVRDRGDIAIENERKLIQLMECGWNNDYNRPTVEYLRFPDGTFYALKHKSLDTMYPFGPGKLAHHCQTFLGFGKSDAIEDEDKENMRHTFNSKPREAYAYSTTDAVNTLLVYEKMEEQNQEVYRAFGIPDDKIGPMRGTVGARVADFVTRTAQQHIAGSEKLRSRRSLQSLMRRGSREPFQDKSESSMFGEQVASTHGGLLFSRSPAKFWHKAPGQLRDVDLSGCYNQIVGSINLYLGRPVVFEPGRQRWTLRQAIELVRQHAPRDGFLIRVTGNISTMPNTLIPSTINALTSDNYRSRTARRRARNLKRYGFELDYLRTLPDAVDDWGGKLYSRRIESGIVTNATWLMIQALPPRVRDEYENLVAETIVFYPNRLIAHDGAQYDNLVEELESEELPWESVLDVDRGELVRTEHFDADYAAMRYPIGEFAQRVAELRAEAKERHGKGSGAEKAWKLMANTMFGVLASDHVETTNYVAANQITATGRAIAFAMMMSLNGIQVITDGCTYRADQIPASTFSNCLQKQPDYPLRRAEEGEAIEFCNGMDIPSDNREFTLWFREHVKRFFDVNGSEYDELFSLHSLEHKTCGEPAQTTFDALGVDGSGNYLKCRVDDDGWTVEDFAARSYKKQSKKVLKDWLVAVYSTDNLTELPPITSDTRLLKFKPAQQKARAALAEGIPEVFMPLGLPDEHVMNYKIIKPSGFVFQTPDQYRAFVKMKDKFENDHGCGLELVAFRRTIRGRRKRGSIADVATWIYELIQAGEHDFVKPLNLNRWGDAILAMVEERLGELDRRRQDAKRRLLEMIDTRNLEIDGQMVGYFVRSEHQVVATFEDPDASNGESDSFSWGREPDGELPDHS